MKKKLATGALALLALLGTACGSSNDAPAPTNTDPLADQCTDAIDSLYQAPSGLSPFSADVRGQVVGCAPYASYTKDEVTQRLAGVPGAVIASGGVHVYLIAYRTAREPATVEGLSTALVFIPERRMANKVPMVLAAHGTVGLADKCAPSHLYTDPTSFLPPEYLDALMLAWAARGLPVVAPDYAGLGTPGFHDYSNWYDPARSAVDGVRALRSLLPAAQLDGGVLVAGHSQGGGVALTVAAISSELPDTTIRAVVAMAPAWRASTSIVDALSLTSVGLTRELRGIAAFTGYSALANLASDPGQYGAMFKPDVRDAVDERVTTLCYEEALSSLDTPATGYVPPATLGDLVDPAFLQQVQDCKGGGDCTTLGGQFVARDKADEPHLSPSSPPVLMIGSMDDEQLKPGQLGCFIDRVESDGAPFDVCMYTGLGHIPLVSAVDTYAIDWALAAAGGGTRPACTGDGTRVGCSLF